MSTYLDFSNIAYAINNFTEYYIMLTSIALFINIVRFYFYNFVSDNRNSQIRELKIQVENMHGVLAEVVRFLNNSKYANAKAEEDEKPEEDEDDNEKPEPEEAEPEPEPEPKKADVKED